MTKRFHGWWITAACLITFGISTGLPYYNKDFFNDYFQKDHGWSISAITFGFPLAALLTLWVGPVIIPRFSPRRLIVAGTGLTFLAFLGFSTMGNSLIWYYFLWFLYTIGYLLSGPIPHQIIISQWFRKKRGTAMGLLYGGFGVVAALGVKAIKTIRAAAGAGFDYRHALLAIGLVMFIAWPIALFVLRDKASDMGQYPDGDPGPPAEQKIQAKTISYLLAQWPFWLLLIGSLCSIGAIGAVNVHMKLVFRDAHFPSQATLDAAALDAQFIILCSSIGGRLLIGWLADVFPMKYVMTVTYFFVAASIPLLLSVTPASSPYTFAVVFGFAMGADYMLIPLMAAKQFGVNSLARSMAVILPVNTIGQTWVPYGVSMLRDSLGSYALAMNVVLGLAVVGAIAIAILPKDGAEQDLIAGKVAPQATRA
jgi:MFS family permease